MSGLSELAGKAAVVTGGASGIGEGIAARLLAQGMKVVISDVQEGALHAELDEVSAAATPAHSR